MHDEKTVSITDINLQGMPRNFVRDARVSPSSKCLVGFNLANVFDLRYLYGPFGGRYTTEPRTGYRSLSCLFEGFLQSPESHSM